MVLFGAAIIDVIISAILIAFGVLVIFFLSDKSMNDRKATGVLVIAVLAVLAGAWLIISSIGVFILLQKIAGLVIAGIGVFLIAGFPGVLDYQLGSMAKTGIFIGIILLVVGLYLLFF
ncbi:MAG: hypothetical protein ABIG30_00775 [Candidatus Aenigmatarchaeota archaeon]